MRKSLLEILACPIDKHSPLELFEINVRLANESYSDPQSKNRESLEEQADKDTTNDNVIIKEGVLYCSHCSRFFPIIDEIPIMLPDELRERDRDLQFLLEWQTKIPSKILDHGVPWHINREQKNTGS
ncbi:MAG TPA: Trm112 family protein [Nitrososphaeraceae archaeon]|nr:Trm112 family protein [Nitrososphaeraceae archaeon]